jgi:ABC-type glycerol-3-phosphate transport system substrate-binding protein
MFGTDKSPQGTIKTINVIEIPREEDPSSMLVTSFPTDKVKEAEDYYKDLIKEYMQHDEEKPSEEDMEAYLEEGYFQNGGSAIMIIWSTN